MPFAEEIQSLSHFTAEPEDTASAISSLFWNGIPKRVPDASRRVFPDFATFPETSIMELVTLAFPSSYSLFCFLDDEKVGNADVKTKEALLTAVLNRDQVGRACTDYDAIRVRADLFEDHANRFSETPSIRFPHPGSSRWDESSRS